MPWSPLLELPGNIVMKTAMLVIESFPWASWEHCYENCSACHGVFRFELPGNIVMKTAVHVMEALPWASWEHRYENCSAFHRVFSMIFLRTLLWNLQCMPCREWSISLGLPGNVVMKSAVHAMESFRWVSWEQCYENCSACHGVFPLSFLGALLWKLQCMSWSLSLWTSWEHCHENYSACHGVLPFDTPRNIVMKTAVHVMESSPWASSKYCYENCSACHRVFPLSFLGTLLWKLQCMLWSLSLWTSWEHCYENCSARHGVFPLSFLGTLLWKLQCMPWSFSFEHPGKIVMKTAVIMGSRSPIYIELGIVPKECLSSLAEIKPMAQKYL